jgi:uncharacterized protein YgbK (DUF1537 family)
MLYTYYGDDFTGSTDVLETLALAGVPAVLFLVRPSLEDLAQFPDVQAIGIAGDSRSRSPEWMTANLPAIFETLKSFHAPIAHYKTCSTFDSAPHIGSIGRAMELGIASFHPCFIPIVVAAPHLGRYVLFGSLFAAAGDEIYRIDQHPTMSRHPVTPMLEPDLRKHLAKQTTVPVALLDIRNITSALSSHALSSELLPTNPAILFDGLDEASLELTGNLLWQQAQQQTLFAIGSSGLTESLIPTWRATGLIPSKPNPPSLADPQKQILVLSGSCSPITQSQIEHALANGFHGITIDPATLIHDPASTLTQTLAALAQGKSPILYTALGPLSAATRPHAAELGEALGKLLRKIMQQSHIRRIVLCGGDTSSHAIQQLPITALTWLAPLSPGAPLCRAHSPDPAFHHAEFVLKGGQVGPANFFELALSGGTR